MDLGLLRAGIAGADFIGPVFAGSDDAPVEGGLREGKERPEVVDDEPVRGESDVIPFYVAVDESKVPQADQKGDEELSGDSPRRLSEMELSILNKRRGRRFPFGLHRQFAELHPLDASGVTATTFLSSLWGVDAKFRGAERGDYTIGASSPAYGIGDSSVWQGVENPLDLALQPRLRGRKQAVDAGCYECQHGKGLTLLVR